MAPTKEDLLEARLKSQITLAKRRVKAFEIANHLIERCLEDIEK